MIHATVARVAGPLVIAEGLSEAKMYDVVRVGKDGLIGEIIELRGDRASIQVYEDTTGVGPGDPVTSTGEPLSVELGPGLLTAIYDGIQRPLEALRAVAGDFTVRGVSAPGLDRARRWSFKPVVKQGDVVVAGDVLGEVAETPLVVHRVMVPPRITQATVVDIFDGTFTVEDVVAVLRTASEDIQVTMIARWPVRVPRPVRRKLTPHVPLVTGQRIVDAFFTVTKGGTACVPGPFGSGKTVIQHQLAKWADADVVVFVGCGERGNEMTDVLMEFPTLTDPYSGRPLMERTVLIANTSNMPVAAREASIYTGITIAEYFRDMGYDVALQADSTSRWAEALREISGRLEEMPGEEGYPAYLTSRLAGFYERAGLAVCLGGAERRGSVTAIGSVSPPGGDLSEPVVQATLRVVKVFWALEDKLAYERHFPAINWLVSYSLYQRTVEDTLRASGDEFPELRNEALALLQKESELKEVVRLVGIDALSAEERLVMEVARSIREDFLQQNAFDEKDTFTSLRMQYLILRAILTFYHAGKTALDDGASIDTVLAATPRERLARLKRLTEKEADEIERFATEIAEKIRSKGKDGNDGEGIS